jgi:hypothetical protein
MLSTGAEREFARCRKVNPAIDHRWQDGHTRPEAYIPKTAESARTTIGFQGACAAILRACVDTAMFPSLSGELAKFAHAGVLTVKT